MNWLADGAMCGWTDSLLSNLPLAYVTLFCVYFAYVSMEFNIGCLLSLLLLKENEYCVEYLGNPSVESPAPHKIFHVWLVES
jgi:hypothetical protein